MGRGPLSAGLLLAVPIVLAPASARADEGAPPEQPVRIQYEAPEGCPDSLSFFLHVRARTQRVRLAQPDELAALVAVRITSEPGTTTGTLEMPGPGGERFSRRVEAASCEEVALALSLVLALAYDPDALTAFPEPTPPATAPGAPPPALPPPPPSPPEPAPPLATPPFELAAAPLVLLRSGIGAGLAPLFGAFVEYGGKTPGFSPSIQVALLLSTEHTATVAATASTPERSVTVQFVGGRVATCPVTVGLGASVALGPCVTLDVARIFGSAGPEVDAGRAGGLTWVSAGLSGRLRWKIAPPLFAEISAGGGLPFRHESFALQAPHQTAFAVPAAYGEAGLAVGLHFP